MYALAAIAFEMLSGVTYGTLIDRSTEQVRRAVQLHPLAVADVLLRGLAFDPDQRTQSIKEFTDEFVRALASAGA